MMAGAQADKSPDGLATMTNALNGGAPPGSGVVDPIRVDVRTASARYSVRIAAGAAATLAGLLDDIGAPRRRVIVSTAPVWQLHSDAVAGVTAEDPILLPDGERYKNVKTVMRIYDALIRVSADRAICLIAIGGGVVGDVTGFAAATYLRGVPIVQVPTTLLAQVDSAIGGKTGVNHPLGKNLIGSYHQPLAVLVDPLLLTTLPRREFRAGLYEAIKYGMIASRPLFDRIAQDLQKLFTRDAGALVPMIADCCRIKADVVSQDERESGPRRALNFGHTAGHALEAVTKYRRFRHGEAVAYGMLAAAELGVTRRTLASADRDALAALITQTGPLPPIGDLSASELVSAIGRDKKVVAGKLHFVLPTSIGSTKVVTDVTTEELAQALTAIGIRS
jgi:3-dehydroquinate synthase